jgi:hypothetical protein
MKYCLFIDVDFSANAGLLASALYERDPDASFCLLQGTSTNAVDDFFKVLPEGLDVSRDVPNLNTEESQWPRHGDASLLTKFEQRLGSERINQCQIAGKYMGDGYLQGGRIPYSPLHKACRSNDSQRRYLAGMLEFFYDYFEREKPDVVFCPWVDRAYLAGMVHVANSLGIPFRRIVVSRVGGYYSISPSMEDKIPQVDKLYGSFVDNPAQAVPWLDEACQYIKDFKQSPQAPGYKSFSTRKLHGKMPLKGMFYTALQALTPGYEPREVQVPYPARMLHAYFLRRWRMKREFRKERWKRWKDVSSGPFAYFPLHYDPEASTMAYTPMVTNQLALIEALAKSLPPSWTLAVKEHSLMIGRRPSEVYEVLSRMPKVELIHPFESSFAMTKSAGLVATISGTVGLEAMLLGKVPFYFGRSFVQGVNEGFMHCSDLEKMPQAVEKAMTMVPVSRERLELFLAAIIASSFTFPIQMIQESSGEDLSDQTRKEAVSTIAEFILKSLPDADNITMLREEYV